MNGGLPAVAALVVALAILSLAAPAAVAKTPREWRIAYLDTGEVVRITDADAAFEFFNAIHYSVAGGTPLAPDPARAPTAEVFGNPCNPGYFCETLWYRYYASTGDGPAYMNYYLSDGTLYESWTSPDLQAKMDSYRSLAPPPNPQRGVPPSPGWGSAAVGVVAILAAIAVSTSFWTFVMVPRRRRDEP